MLRNQSINGANKRGAFSLIEVIIALFIFMISFIAVFELINIGTDRAMDTQAMCQASLMCQSKLNELTIGSLPLSPVSWTPEEDNPSFQYQIDADQGEFDNLWNVVVHVKYEPEGRDKSLEVTLAQMIVDPSIRGSTLEPLPMASTDNTPPATTTSATGATTTGTGAMTTGTGATTTGTGATTTGTGTTGTGKTGATGGKGG